MSVPPPGGNGRMNRTGLLGQASGAWATDGTGTIAVPAAKSSAQRNRGQTPITGELFPDTSEDKGK
jgi:hypothetical protein